MPDRVRHDNRVVIAGLTRNPCRRAKIDAGRACPGLDPGSGMTAGSSTEPVNRRPAEPLSRAQDRAREMRMIGRIGVVRGLQAKGAAPFIEMAAFADVA